MYDPARDTFTASAAVLESDDASAETLPNPQELSSAEPPKLQDDQSAPTPKLELDLKENKSPTSHRSPKRSPPTNTKSRKRSLSASENPHKKAKLAPPRQSPQRSLQKPPRTNHAYLRRSQAPNATPTRPRSPTPPPRSPPRQRKRPGATSRIAAPEKEAVRQRQLERERDEIAKSQAIVASRGVHDVVRQHYNAVPQRGRDWRQTDSRIRGLRNYNNWVKSTLIQKFSPNEGFVANTGRGGGGPPQPGLLVLDIGCGKGGDLGKWAKAPQRVELYVGIDPAEVSIEQAQNRYAEMRGRGRGRVFQGEFFAKDGYGEWIGEIPLVKEVGIDGSVGPNGGGSARWGGGGFDVVTMMFCMHYAFESEAKTRGMLRNVAGTLKKGGRFIGVIPNSDVLRGKVEEFHKEQAAKKKERTEKDGGSGGPEDGEVDEVTVPEWGNSIYRVRFPGKTPEDGVFRPPFGWKYSYFMEEAVEEVPEYVVPWEAFRALAEDYNLEMQYRKPFADVWKEEKDDPVLGPLSVRMGVRASDDGPLQLTDEELEAVSFYHAFCFYKA
ncbi:mRNA cap guanine-N7 methyltransferase [Trapelia coarctata]|nr:mRNA cap guanine-N7 methyltransferase [Trapelia coarctata]